MLTFVPPPPGRRWYRPFGIFLFCKISKKVLNWQINLNFFVKNVCFLIFCIFFCYKFLSKPFFDVAFLVMRLCAGGGIHFLLILQANQIKPNEWWKKRNPPTHPHSDRAVHDGNHPKIRNGGLCVISKALAQTKTTQVYIREINDERLAAANQTLLSTLLQWLKYPWKCNIFSQYLLNIDEWLHFFAILFVRFIKLLYIGKPR